MTSTPVESVPVDPDELMSFVLTAVGEVGAALNAALVVLGDKLGYYRTLAGLGPLTAVELAEATGTDSHYTREWLNAQAAGNYLTYHPGSGTYTLSPERALALTDPSSPAFLPGLFQLAVGTIVDWQRVLDSARDGSGIGWHEHNSDVHSGCERFFRPAYRAHLITDWLPALDGVVDKLRRGARVADIGCGHGASTILMAQAFPNTRFLGSDLHAESVRTATRRAADAGLATQVSFEKAAAQSFPGDGYDLVTTFDALHDMGDPVGAARRVYEALAVDGTWMIVEPAAGDRVEDNLHPIGRAYYAFSTLLCTPSSLAQPVGAALGTQAGPARLRDVMTAAGFTRCRVAAQTPFHMVLEVRR